MNEKLYNHTDQRARDAANKVQPPFDEQSWERMEALLDDKKKRPFIIWFFLSGLLILIFGWSIYYFSPIHIVQKIVQQPVSAKSSDQTHRNSIHPSIRNKIQPDTLKIVNDAESISVLQIRAQKFSNGYVHPDTKISEVNDLADELNISKKRSKKNTKSKLTIVIASSEISEANDREVVIKSMQNLNTENFISTSIAAKNTQMLPDDTLVVMQKDTAKKSDSIKLVVQVKSEINQDKKKNAKKWYLLAGIGLETSNVKLFSFSNSILVPKFGIGVGFRLYKKWHIQTGFYVSGKKYMAGPGDYKPATGSYWSNVEIIKADANCLVYDIPLTVRFNFKPSGKIHSFVTAGLHSFIMKKETYDYAYLLNTYTYRKTYSYTGNKGFFGLLSFSAGIEKPLNDRFSILAEPFFTVPLKGVGEGNVKLFSTGIQGFIKYSFN